MTSATPYERAVPGQSPRGTVIAGVGLVVLGMQMFIIQPAFMALFVKDLGFDETRAGYVASAEMVGIAAATIMAAAASARISLRALGILAAALLAGANAASAIAHGEIGLMVCRAVAGFGSGLLISIGYTMVGRASDKDRAFGYTITAVLLYGALAILLLPAASSLFGTSNLFLLLAAASLLALVALPCIPTPTHDTVPGPDTGTAATIGPREFTALCAVMLFFLAQGLVWAYLALIGLSHGVSEQAVSNGLTLAQVAGIAGALSLTWIAARTGFLPLLAIGCIGSIISLLVLVSPVEALGYGASVIVFNFFANLMTAMLMAMVAKIGGDAGLVPLAAALQMIGLAVGPTFSALLVADSGFAGTLVTGSALFVLVLACGIFAGWQPKIPNENAVIVRHINSL